MIILYYNKNEKEKKMNAQNECRMERETATTKNWNVLARPLGCYPNDKWITVYTGDITECNSYVSLSKNDVRIIG